MKTRKKASAKRAVRRAAEKAGTSIKRVSAKGKKAPPKTGKTRAKAQRKAKTSTRRKGADRCEAVVEVSEITGAGVDNARSDVTCKTGSAAAKGSRRGTEGGTKGGAKTKHRQVTASTWRAMAAVGHEVRAKLMVKLLEGPANYKTLKRVARQEAGPLYHHIAQLRLAGLILPKQRDLYELTRGGRNLILVTLAMSPLVGDRRRRPVDTGAR